MFEQTLKNTGDTLDEDGGCTSGPSYTWRWAQLNVPIISFYERSRNR